MLRALQIGNRQSAPGNVTAVSKRPAMESAPSALTGVKLFIMSPELLYNAEDVRNLSHIRRKLGVD